MKILNINKKIILAFAALSACLLVFAAVRVQADDTVVTVNSEAELQAAVSQAGSEGETEINIGADIQLKSPVEINLGSIAINGAGHTLSLENENDNDAIIKVSGGNISLEDITLSSGLHARTIYVSEGASVNANNTVMTGRLLADEGISIYNAGTLTLDNCQISGASHASVNYKGVIYNAGTLNILEGTGIDSESFVYTGTVYNDGTFNMSGGTFGGTGSNSNRKDYGAAVTNNGTFNMSGGLITGCKNSEAVLSKGTFIMNGGSISGNTSTCVSGMTYNSVMSGGGVLVYGGVFEMYDGALISDNTGYMGAGVGVYYTGTVFNMYGGTISGNTAGIDPAETTFNKNNGCGGGVGIYGGAEFYMYGGSITENTAYIGDTATINTMGAGNRSYAATGLGGGIYIMNGLADISGGTISGNSALCGSGSEDGGLGGGIYIKDEGNAAAKVNISGGTITGNTAQGGDGNDIYSGSEEVPTADIICLNIGGDAQIGDIYLGTNRTMLGIGTEINALNVDSLSSNGRYSIGASIARYEDGVESRGDDASKLHFTGIADLKLSDDGRELVIGMMDLAKVTSVAIEDTVFTGKEIIAASLNATLYVGDIELEAPGLSGLRIESASEDINVGTAYISLRGDNIRYTGLIENVPFNITPMPLDSDGITAVPADPEAVYIADGVTQFKPDVKVSLDSQSSDEQKAYLKEGPDGDYTLIYDENVNAGTGYVYITATDNPGSNFTGSRAFSFEILDESHFYDVLGSNDASADDYQYYYDAVYWASGNGYISGVGGGYFGIGDTVTKGEYLVMLWKYAGSPESDKYKDPAEVFADITGSGSDLYKAAAWGWSEGIIGGMMEGEARLLNPDALLSRADMTVMLWRLAGRPRGVGKLRFTDVDEAGYKRSTDMYKAIVWITKNNIAKGYKLDDGTDIYGLTKVCNKEYIVTYLYRYDKLVSEE